jgi:hypothetical protein
VAASLGPTSPTAPGTSGRRCRPPPTRSSPTSPAVTNVPGVDGTTIGGTRAGAVDPNGHPAGLALDYMVGSDAALGDAVAQYHIAHWDELGVDYIIWQQKILTSPTGS